MVHKRELKPKLKQIDLLLQQMDALTAAQNQLKELNDRFKVSTLYRVEPGSKLAASTNLVTGRKNDIEIPAAGWLALAVAFNTAAILSIRFFR